MSNYPITQLPNDTVTPEQIRWFRLRRQGLVEPFDSPETAVSALVGIQAQILSAAAVSLWNRTTGLTYTQFEDLLFNQRKLVKTWAQRGTLHLYPSHEWPMITGALSGRLSWWERTAKNEGELDKYQEALKAVLVLLEEQKIIGRSHLRAANLDLPDDYFSSWGGIFYDLVKLGHACHAKADGNEGLFAHRAHWLPGLPWNPPSHDEANIELFRRYLRAYGPATLQDMAYWRGATLGNSQRWFKVLETETAEIQLNNQPLFILKSDLDTLHEAPPPREAWPVRLLYRFEPLLLGHKDKSWLLDMKYYNRVWRPAGHIEGVVLEYGRIIATWRYDRKGNGLVVTVNPFTKPTKKVEKAVARHANNLATFFGLPLNELHFGD